MKKYIIAICLGSLAIAPFAYADFTPGTWKYMKPIMMTATDAASQYVKVYLDRDVSFTAKPDLSDIRVVADNNSEVPYQIVVDRSRSEHGYVGGKLHDLSLSGGKTMFMLDLSEAGVIHDHLTILTTSKNFKHKVSVYAADKPLSMTDASWRLLTNAGYIYNFSDQAASFDSGSGEVLYPENTSRYLRVVIEAGEGSDVAVSSAQVARERTFVASQSMLESSAKVTENSTMKSTEVAVDLGGRGLPTNQIKLITPDVHNFSRRASVQGSNDGSNWQNLALGELFKLSTPVFTGEHLDLEYPESDMRYLRVVIFNNDDQPILWVPRVVISGIDRSVVFAAVPGKEYALYYGNEKAFIPEYDLARFFQYIESTQLTHAALGAQVMNPAYTPPAPKAVPYSEKSPNILNFVLVLLVAVITALIIWYLKKLKLANRGPRA